MKAALAKFYGDYKYGLPFLILFLSSFFLPAASHRMVFYLLSPVLIGMLYMHRASLGNFIRTRSFWLLVAYLGYFSLTFLWSAENDFEAFLKMLRNVMGIFVFSLSLAFVIPRIPFTSRTPVYLAGLCLAFGVASAAVFYGVDGAQWQSRIIGLGRYQNSIHFAYLMSLAIIGLVCLGLEGRRRDIALRLALVLGLLFFVALSQTRSAYVALLACVIMMAVLGHARYAAVMGILAIVCAGLAYMTWGFSFNDIAQRLDSYRFDIWSQALGEIKNDPWLGQGIATWPKFSAEVINSKGGWKSTHNIYVGHLYTGGIIGFTVFMAMIANMIKIGLTRWYQERRDGRISSITNLVGLVFCFTMISGMFVFTHFIVNVHIHWLVFWVPFAVLWSMEAQERNRVHA